MTRWRSFLLVAVWLAFSPLVARAEAPPPAVVTPAPAVISVAPIVDLDGLLKEIDSTQKGLSTAAAPPSDDEIASLRARLSVIRGLASKARANAKAMEASALDQVKALGPPPGETDPPEQADIVKLRRSIDKLLADARARIGKAELLDTKSVALDTALSNSRHEETARVLTKRGPVLVAFRPLIDGFAELGHQLYQLADLPFRWWRSLNEAQIKRLPIIQLVILLLLAGFAAFLSRFAVSRRLTHMVWPENPSERHKVMAALLAMLARGVVPGSVLISLLVVALQVIDGPNAPLTGLFGRMVVQLLLLLLLFVLVEAFLRVIFNPMRRGLRLTPIDREKGKLLYRGFTALSLFYVIDNLVIGLLLAQGLVVDGEGEAVYDFLTGFPQGILILWLMRTKHWVSDDPNTPPLYPYFRKIISLAVLVGLGAQLAGYHSFGWFVLGGLIATGGIAVALLAVRLVLRAAIFALVESPRLIAMFAIEPERDRRRLEFWLRLIFDPSLIGCFIYLAAPFWSIPQEELIGWINEGMNGVALGEITLQPLNILYGLGTLIGLLALTRGSQRTLIDKVLPASDFSPQTRHAVAASIGYVGVTASIMLSVSVMGLSLSNLALITSALSVGIGFGLRDVIANFVAGMILLFDRPIRVGDRIKLNDGEGTVRKMSLRATEIETGQRGTLLIPNLTLLTAPVTNWSLGDSSMRFTVPITVSNNSNLDRLTEIMLNAADNHAEIRKIPVPRVTCTSFGPPGITLELACVTSNGQNRGLIESDLRFVIAKGIQEADDIFWIKADGSPIE